MSCQSTRAALLAALSALAMSPTGTQAHTVADPDRGPAGGYLRTAFRVSHGCKDSPTVAISVSLPEGVLSAKPMPKPGWTIEIKTKALATPVDNGHGGKIRETTSEVTWRGGRLDNAQFDEFVMMMRLPEGAGRTIYFPTVQTCETGANNWTGIPTAVQKWGDLAEPAPFVTLQAQASTTSAPDYRIGSLEIGRPWSRATPTSAMAGGGFLTVTNKGATADRLVSARSPAAGRVEIHEMKMDGNVMRMRALEKGLEIPPGGMVTLAPGGYHLMLMELKGPLVRDSRVPMTLTFEKAGVIEVELQVEAMGAGQPAHKH